MKKLNVQLTCSYNEWMILDKKFTNIIDKDALKKSRYVGGVFQQFENDRSVCELIIKAEK